MDRKFVATGLGFGILGLGLGIYMAASKNHGQLVTHAHIMLVGFVVSFIYGVCHKLWLGNNESGLARIQFYLHVIGAIGITVGLFLMYGGIVAAETIEPVLSISSIAVLLGMILMKVLFVRSKNA
jgi:hypothetical protein